MFWFHPPNKIYRNVKTYWSPTEIKINFINFPIFFNKDFFFKLSLTSWWYILGVCFDLWLTRSIITIENKFNFWLLFHKRMQLKDSSQFVIVKKKHCRFCPPSLTWRGHLWSWRNALRKTFFSVQTGADIVLGWTWKLANPSFNQLRTNTVS